MSQKNELKYRALADAALAAAEGQPIDRVATKGLAAAIEYVDLIAGELVLWDNRGEVLTRAVAAKTEEEATLLSETESSLLMMLRRTFTLTSAYMELGGEKARSLFFLPVETNARQFGALIGIKKSRARLHDYDEFLRSLASVLALAVAPDKALNDLAVGANHAINNALTPLLGNLDLLRDVSFPDDVRRKLDVIRDSANQIEKLTARMKEAARLPRKPYVDGEWMVDLSGEGDETNDTEEKNSQGDSE